MKPILCVSLTACTFLAPVITNLPLGPGALARTHVPVRSSEIDAGSALTLGSLRGGRVALPARMSAAECNELRAASVNRAALGEMRAGFLAPTDREWLWIALGAAVVLILVLL